MPLFEYSVFDDVPAESEAAVLLARATRNLDYEHRQMRERVAALNGVSVTEFNALVLITQAKGTLTPRVLSDYLHMSTSATTAVLDRLERQQLIERRPNPDDRRSFLLRALPLGQRVAGDISTGYVRSMQAVVEELGTGAGLERLIEHLRLLTTAVSHADQDLAAPTAEPAGAPGTARG